MRTHRSDPRDTWVRKKLNLVVSLSECSQIANRRHTHAPSTDQLWWSSSLRLSPSRNFHLQRTLSSIQVKFVLKDDSSWTVPWLYVLQQMLKKKQQHQEQKRRHDLPHSSLHSNSHSSLHLNWRMFDFNIYVCGYICGFSCLQTAL